VTLADLMPVRIGFRAQPARTPRQARKHRAIDEIDRQRTLRAGADLLIKGLRLQLQDQEAAHAEVVARIDARHAEVVQGLERQIAELERRLNTRVLAEHVVAKTQELDPEEVRRACTPIPLHQSPLANPAHVPAWAVHAEEVR
jgi:hypothetical protein